MEPGNIFAIPATSAVEPREPVAKSQHPAWRAFIRYCAELQHGEIEILKIQDGWPGLAEVTIKKVKFGR